MNTADDHTGARFSNSPMEACFFSRGEYIMEPLYSFPLMNSSNQAGETPATFHPLSPSPLLVVVCKRLPKGKTAFDVATAAHETECARLLTTTFFDLPRPAPALGWRDGRRCGEDIAGGREGVSIPWVNELDDEPFPRYGRRCHRRHKILKRQRTPVCFTAAWWKNTKY